jgi:hypothetical protein
MLTPDQVTAVSRNIIGHMTTDPAIRTKMDIDPNGAGAAASLAATINAATQFTPPVTADDIPAILTAIRTIGAAHPNLEATSSFQGVLFFKSS